MPPFLKQRACPSAEQLLAYSWGGLSPLDRARVSAHCAACDFCNAELQLLTQHPAGPDVVPEGTLSPVMQVLAEKLMAEHVQPKKPRQQRAA